MEKDRITEIDSMGVADFSIERIRDLISTNAKLSITLQRIVNYEPSSIPQSLEIITTPEIIPEPSPGLY